MLRRIPIWITCSTLALTGCPSDDAPGDAGDEASSSTEGSDTETDTTSMDTGTDTSAQPTGEELYAGYCSACHGPSGEGTNIAYEIRHPHDGFATWVVRNGRTSIEFAGMMPQFSSDTLPDEDLALILAYLDSLPQPTGGEALYLDYCRNCHGVDALGGVSNAEIVNSPIQDYIENVRQGRGGSNYGVRTLFMPVRSSAELSDAEIQEIFDYVGTL